MLDVYRDPEDGGDGFGCLEAAICSDLSTSRGKTESTDSRERRRWRWAAGPPGESGNSLRALELASAPGQIGSTLAKIIIPLRMRRAAGRGVDLLRSS